MDKLHSICRGLILLSFIIIASINISKASTPTNCNTPLVGNGRIVNSVYAANPLFDNVVNGNLNDSVFITTGAVASLTTLISVKDINNTWTAGTRTGFTVKTTGLSLTPTNLNGFQIVTLKGGIVQEAISTTSTPALGLTYIGASNGKFRISFVTTKDFDEVALQQTSLLSGITSVSVFYAFVEPASGCDYNCITPVLTGSYPSATVAQSDNGGVCVACATTNLPNMLNASTTDFATFNITAGVGVTRGIQLKIGTTIPAGSGAGFVIGPNTGLLNLELLGAITIKTYLANAQQESVSYVNGLVNVVVLSGEIRAVSIRTTKSFDEMRIIVNAGLLSLTANTNVYYGFIRKDSDHDGFPDCVDRCVGGDDGMDSNGNGIPDACDTSCNFNAGPDVYLHPQATSFDFSTRNLGSGITWQILPSSPAGATVSSTGLVQNITQAGTYSIQATKSSCTDVVNIYHNSIVQSQCHKAIVGPNAQIFEAPGAVVCIGCGIAGSGNVTNGNLNDYLTVNSLFSTGITPIIGVKDISQTYPAGYKAGFVIEPLGGLLNATVLSSLRIRTYLDGTLQDDVDVSGSLAQVKLLSGSGNKVSLSATTTKPFNSIALVSTALINVLSGIRVYYAFTDPASGCPTDGCYEYLLAGNGYEGQIEYARTGLTAGVCALCNITGLSNILDADNTNYATINQSVGLGSVSSISVKTTQTRSTNYQAGFIISGGSNLLNASVLNGITINTYNNGVLANTFLASNTSLVGIGIIDSGTGQSRITVKPTQPFNEIQISFSSLVSALQSLNIYNVFFLKDSDGDNIPDCIDKCALGDDNLDTDGDGIPDMCDFNLSNNLTCTNNLLTMTITPASGYNYSLYQGNTLFGNFSSNTYSYTPTQSGVYNFTMRTSNGTNTYILQDLSLAVYPSTAKWTPANSTAATWRDNLNWTDTTTAAMTHLYPIWCTDAVMPGNAISYPSLVTGDQCRDVYFKDGASIGKIQTLKYRHAYVELRPKRNQWTMLTAPLRHMYSADYHADYSWTNAISPKIFMRYFDVNYKTNQKTNPDGVKGFTSGNFSRAFANLSEPLSLGKSFVLWVNGAPGYVDTNFPSPRAYQLPRRNGSGGDVQYSYHNAAGTWIETPFYMPDRGTDISTEAAWTETSTPVYTSRYRFNYESISTNGGNFSIPTSGGSTIMVGNPFMSHLDFNRFASDNSAYIQDYYRIWNGEQFYTYVGSGSTIWRDLEGISTSAPENSITSNIPPMQSFFVETKVTGSFNLLYTPAASVTDATSKLKNSTDIENVLRLGLKMDGKQNQAILACNPSASSSYNQEEDIFKLFSFNDSYPEIYTVAGENAIEINLIGIESGDQIIPIGIKTDITGEGQLYIDGLNTFNAYREAYLLDKSFEKYYDLKKSGPVNFTKTDKNNLEGRFYILLTNEPLSIIENIGYNENITVDVHDGSITVKSDKSIDELYLYNALGQICHFNDKVNKNETTFGINLPKGMYLLKVSHGTKAITYRLIL